MPEIDIHIDRPVLTLTLAGLIVAGIVYGTAGTNAAGPVGGDTEDHNPTMIATNAEADMAHIRQQQQVLSLREQILRDQLALLEEQYDGVSDISEEDLLTTRDELIALLQDKAAAEQKIVASLHEYWAAEGYAFDASRRTTDDSVAPQFYWPVEPDLGVSAHFEDSGYERRFGMPHNAIDIPVVQGSVIGAAADGVVTKISDQGMGFSSIVLSHNGGMATMYGHVSGFLVQEGDRVEAGDPIALSGGTPGTKGAGLMTTGAHLHLAFYKDGSAVDPLGYLPEE